MMGKKKYFWLSESRNVEHYFR